MQKVPDQRGRKLKELCIRVVLQRKGNVKFRNRCRLLRLRRYGKVYYYSDGKSSEMTYADMIIQVLKRSLWSWGRTQVFERSSDRLKARAETLFCLIWSSKIW